MKKLLELVKLGLFAAAVGIVGSSIAASNAYADDALCKGTGDSCTIIIGDSSYSFKQVEA